MKGKTNEQREKSRASLPCSEISFCRMSINIEYLVTAEDSKKDRPLSSLNSVIQEIVIACEQLNSRDRQVVLNLAKFLKKG